MKVDWKSLALVLSGILVGCAGNAAQTAFAGSESGGGQFKCLGPSGSSSGVEEDLHVLASEGYTFLFATDKIVCGKR